MLNVKKKKDILILAILLKIWVVVVSVGHTRTNSFKHIQVQHADVSQHKYHDPSSSTLPLEGLADPYRASHLAVMAVRTAHGYSCIFLEDRSCINGMEVFEWIHQTSTT